MITHQNIVSNASAFVKSTEVNCKHYHCVCMKGIIAGVKKMKSLINFGLTKY